MSSLSFLTLIFLILYIRSILSILSAPTPKSNGLNRSSIALQTTTMMDIRCGFNLKGKRNGLWSYICRNIDRDIDGILTGYWRDIMGYAGEHEVAASLWSRADDRALGARIYMGNVKGFWMEYEMASDLHCKPVQTLQSRAIQGAALFEMHMALSPFEFASGNASVSMLCGLYNAMYVILYGSAMEVCIAGFETSFYAKKWVFEVPVV